MATERSRSRLGRGLSGMVRRQAGADAADGSAALEAAPDEPSTDASGGAIAVERQEVGESPADDRVVDGSMLEVDRGQLTPNQFQPRERIAPEGLEALADSIRESGVLQPILVRPREGGGFEIIAGERRWQAAGLAGLDRVPVLVRAVSDVEAAQWALVENLQRQDLDPVEQARAMRGLVDRFGLSHEEIARRLGMSRSSVSNQMRVLELDEPILAMLTSRALSTGHAKALLAISDPKRRRSVARRAAAEGWSVRRLEDIARGAAPAGGDAQRTEASGSSQAGSAEASDPTEQELQVRDLAGRLSGYLGTEVRIEVRAGTTSGRLVISFYDSHQLEGVLDCIGFNASDHAAAY